MFDDEHLERQKSVNALRDAADAIAAEHGVDDTMHPWHLLDPDIPFHSWREFVSMVCRPLLDAEENGNEVAVQKYMKLYRKTNPHYIATCLVLAANAAQLITDDM